MIWCKRFNRLDVLIVRRLLVPVELIQNHFLEFGKFVRLLSPCLAWPVCRLGDEVSCCDVLGCESRGQIRRVLGRASAGTKAPKLRVWCHAR